MKQELRAYSHDGFNGQEGASGIEVDPQKPVEGSLASLLRHTALQVALNGQALTPDLSEEDWVRFITLCFPQRRQGMPGQGKPSIRSDFAPKLDSLKKNMGLPPISDEAVYMSGIYLTHESSHQITALTTKIADPNRTFPDEAARERQLKKEKANLILIDRVHTELRKATLAFGEKKLPDEKYRAVLEAIATLHGYKTQEKRDEMMQFLKKRNIEAAYKLTKGIDKPKVFE